MEKKRFQNRTRPLSLFLISFSLVFLFLSAIALYRNKTDRNLSVTLNRFQSDFVQKDTRTDLREDQILKKNKFVAFGAYSILPPGINGFDHNPSRSNPAGFWHLSDSVNNLLSLQNMKFSGISHQKPWEN